MCGSGRFGREWANVEFLRTATRNEGKVSNKNMPIGRLFFVVKYDNMHP